MSDEAIEVHKRPVRRQLINVIHHNRCMWDRDWFGKGHAIQIVERVWFSDGTSVKRVVTKEKPIVVYRVTEGDKALKRPHTFVKAEDCVEYESPYDKIDEHAASLTGQQQFYQETRGPGQRERRRLIHMNHNLHGTDVNLTDHYIGRYMDAYKDMIDRTVGLECGFADVEVDIGDYDGFPDPLLPDGPPAPINLLSYMHRPTRTMTIRVGRYSARPNPQIAEFEAGANANRVWLLGEVNRATFEKAGLIYPQEIAEGDAPPSEKAVEKMRFGARVPTGEEIADMMNTDEAAHKTARCHDVILLFFDDELALLLDFLHQVNEVDKPDALMFWHAEFDFNTITGRLRKLGVDPEVAMCPEEVRPRTGAQYDRDTFNIEPSDDGSTMTVNGGTIWLDQMLVYASLRKQAGKAESYSLDHTIRTELKEHKLEYEGTIREFPYNNFKNFVLYNALDVAPMATLEDKTGDIDLLYRLSLMTRTRITKVMKKTICLRNFAEKFFGDKGLILSNNHNRGNPRTGEKFRGAFVADPALMRPTGITVGGARSKTVHDDVIDFDASSMYPSIMIAFNVDADGQLGRVVIPSVHSGAEATDQDSAEIMEVLACGDVLEAGRLLLGMPGLDVLAAQVLDAPDEGASV